MNFPPPPSPHIIVTTGSLPSPKLQHVAASYPFSHQLDVIFPTSDALETALSTLKTYYVKATVKLWDIIEDAETFVNQRSFDSNLMVLSTNPPQFDDDHWCIDQRGLLTISVCKETYGRLGLVGTKLSPKKKTGKYVIQVPLHNGSQPVNARGKCQAALKAWDSRREEAGLGAWDVLYNGTTSDLIAEFAARKGHTVREVECQIQRSSDIHVPIVRLSPSPTVTSSRKMHEGEEDEDMQDWNADISALLEWVGMAGLGAQRLAANDRVDSYVAVYEPPEPSRIGNITRLRWRGFLPPVFIQLLIDTVIAALSATPTSPLNPQFISITSHTVPGSPVSYISPSAFVPGSGKASVLGVPLEANRVDVGNTWCLIFANGTEKEHDDSIGETAAQPWSWLKADNLEM